eukprot:1637268-Prorocentrum_lima.AAC.1
MASSPMHALVRRDLVGATSFSACTDALQICAVFRFRTQVETTFPWHYPGISKKISNMHLQQSAVEQGHYDKQRGP